MEHSKLEKHKFKKGKFITPWNDMLGDIGVMHNWVLERLPEYVWIGLVFEAYGRKKGMEKCYNMITKLHELNPTINVPTISNPERNTARYSALYFWAIIYDSSCSPEAKLMNPKRLCDTIAYELRKLHETDYTGCPIADRTAEYLVGAEENYHTGNYDKSQFPDSFGYRSAKEAYDILIAEKDALQSKVLLHGDYCLPNIILDNWKFSGFIDVGNGGVGDRHIDLFWGVWTLWFNLKTNKYQERFLDAYGRDKADETVLKIIAAAEVFG